MIDAQPPITPPEGPPAQLLRRLQVRALTALPALPFAEARVWRAETPDGPLALKRHHRPAGYHAERAALQTWGPQLAGRVPALIDSHDGGLTLALTWLEGESGAATSGSPALHRGLGAFVARLRELPLARRDPLPLEAAVARRAQAWLGRAAGHAPAELLAEAASLIEAEAFAGVGRVVCHRDLRPANTIITDARVQVLDFGHARLDAPETDLVKLACGPWRHQPSLREAFFEGLAADWTGRHEKRLRSLCALHGVATLAWAASKGDDAGQREGLAVLRWLVRPRGAAG